MEDPRLHFEELEKLLISEHGVLASQSRGRVRPEEECGIRTCFQRDIDRITHSKSFRRLKQKTQVFLHPEGDHYRTRLTHTLEVSRLARTIARALRLNEDLTEAIALGHDLGHTPFGHAGERALSQIMQDEGGFRHNEQSLRVVDEVEKNSAGLNLTLEVRDGILCHTGGDMPCTAEGLVVRLADRAAYINHDFDDAVRAGILEEGDLPDEIVCAVGDTYTKRINSIVYDIIASSKNGNIAMSPQIAFVFDSFHSFMWQYVYKNERAKGEESKVFGILNGIFGYYVDNPALLPQDYRILAERSGTRRAVCDYVSGMTDTYAIHCYEEIYIPAAWQVL